MKFLGKDYYIGLLNAVACYDAVHQQPQSFSIVTMDPSLRSINTDYLKITLSINREWIKDEIVRKRAGNGFVDISSPELTSLEFVSYSDNAGGLNIVTTVLVRLCKNIDANKMLEIANVYDLDKMNC